MSGPPPWDSRHVLLEQDVRQQNRSVLDAVIAAAPAERREALRAEADQLLEHAEFMLERGYPLLPYSLDFADVEGVLVPDPMRLGHQLQIQLRGTPHGDVERHIIAQEDTSAGWLSTVFLHQVASVLAPNGTSGEDVPLLYETMLFPGTEEEHSSSLACWRYPNRRAAEEGHRRIAAAIAQGTGLPSEDRQQTLIEAVDALFALLPPDEGGPG